LSHECYLLRLLYLGVEAVHVIREDLRGELFSKALQNPRQLLMLPVAGILEAQAVEITHLLYPLDDGRVSVRVLFFASTSIDGKRVASSNFL
jgi:hypothetical protein